MAEKINNLGRYADLSAVWNRHPEGGREGDYILIGAEEYMWDKYVRNWVAGGTSQGGDQGQTVGGDLNVNGDLNVTGDATIGGTLHVNDIQVGNAGRFKGQSSFKMSVFTRRDGKPDVPQGGDYSNPLPYGIVWQEGIPQGNKPLWMSSRTYTSDGLAPQGDWSDPVMLVDSDTFDVEFSNAPTSSIPAEPNASNIGWLWFDPVRNPTANWQSMNWMAIRHRETDTQGVTDWSEWTIVLIRGARGADGDGYENVFYRTSKKVAPTFIVPNSDQAAYQQAGYCPTVTNKNNCGGVDNKFTADPRGVSETLPYEWVIQRRRRNGVWQNFSSPAVIFATYSKEHTISISDDGYWVIDGNKTDKKAIGQGVTVKGRVDFYSTGSTGYTSGASTLEDITGPELGDSYVVVENGHLYLCVADTGTLAEIWEDLGEFKGEKGDDGASAYLYLAWATNVEFNDDAEQTFYRATGFTTDPAEGQSYPWMGIKVSGTELTEQQLTPEIFKWNYLAGRDGTDYEYVYIRTSVDTAPTIDPTTASEDGYQSQEVRPYVDNIQDDYTYTDGSTNNTIESDRFFDDPKGVSERWPYEWQSKRERINGVWQAFQSPAVLHRNWAEPGSDGNDGKDALSVRTSKSVITIDADADGKLAAQKTVTLNCWLCTADDYRTITDADILYGGTRLNHLLPGMAGQGFALSGEGIVTNAKVTITVILPASTVLESKDIDITLNGMAKATVPVAIVRRGAKGASGDTGASLRFRGAFDPNDTSKSYTWNRDFRDCVKYDGGFWMVGEYNAELLNVDVPGDGQENPWVHMGDNEFVATQLLLAENGAINLLSSNVINLLDAGGNRIASLNADNHGSYCIYYPGTDKKMMEFSWTGYIIYYNNNEDNSVEWRLGYGGEIEKGDTWNSLWLSGVQLSSFNAETKRWELTTYYQFFAGLDSEYPNLDGCILDDADTEANLIPDGYYTPNTSAKGGKITVYRIAGGKIVAEGMLNSNGTYSDNLNANE